MSETRKIEVVLPNGEWEIDVKAGPDHNMVTAFISIPVMRYIITVPKGDENVDC